MPEAAWSGRSPMQNCEPHSAHWTSQLIPAAPRFFFVSGRWSSRLYVKQFGHCAPRAVGAGETRKGRNGRVIADISIKMQVDLTKFARRAAAAPVLRETL